MEGQQPPRAEFPAAQVILQRLALLREAAAALRASDKGRARLLIGQALAHEPGHLSPLGALAHLSKPGDYRTITSEILVQLGGLARQLRRGSFGGADLYDIRNAPDRLDYLIGRLEAAAPGLPSQGPAPEQPPPQKRVTCNALMVDIIAKRPEAKTFTSRQWADATGFCKTTVLETPTWKALEKLRAQTKAEMALHRAEKKAGRL